ncbi:hypothetical protein [Aeromicrobium sp. NPDC092404]|uniref:hypothetical protein n=1 Tax=Aeromicrobium sp. NPDC092404 TaxID=3154976 RepID=UPI003447486C
MSWLMTSSAEWAATKIGELDFVSDVEILGDPFLRVHRLGMEPVEIAVVSVSMLGGGLLRAIVETNPDVVFVLNVPRDSDMESDLFHAALDLRVAFGGLGDAYRALRMRHPHEYEDREVLYVERILSQHSSIRSFTRVSRFGYSLHRFRGDSIFVHIESVYEVTAEKVREAIGRYGSLDAFVTSNPNNHSIAQPAVDVGMQSGVEVLLWPEFMSRLNF